MTEKIPPHINKMIDDKLANSDRWSQNALALIRQVYLLRTYNITEEKLTKMQNQAKDLLPKRFIMEKWGE